MGKINRWKNLNRKNKRNQMEVKNIMYEMKISVDVPNIL